MPEDITFFDLAALLKIKQDTTVERYGGMLNSSYFDGANIAGSLSQKKLITFNTAMPGQSVISVTDTGKQLLSDADTRAAMDFDHLDLAILNQVAAGKSTPMDIGKSTNVRAQDLAMHLYKLSKTGYITYEFRSGAVAIMLTEKGFAQSKAGMPVKQAQVQTSQQIQAATSQMQAGQQQETPGAAMPAPPVEAPPEAGAQPTQPVAGKKGKKMLIIAVVLIIVIAAALYYLNYKGIITL